MIVVDTNIVVHFVLGSAETARMEALRVKDNQWLAPALLRYELLNVLTRFMHRNLLSRDEAVRVYRRAVSTVEIDETIPDPVTILNLHQRSECTSYDCQFVATAETANLKLVTLDQQVLQKFPDLAVTPEGI